MEEKELKGIVEKFNVEGTIASIRPLGNGLINDTYLVVTAGENDDYVLQRINNSIFQNVDLLQHNVEAVTSHIRKKLIEAGEDDISRKELHFVETGEGKTYYMDGAGRYWRVSVFIPRAKTFEAVTPEYSYYAGKAFGNFEAMLVDLPETLGETIPDFHNMELRMRQLRDAVAQDAKGRLSEVRDIVDELESHAHEMCKAERMGREGKLPKRVCHCDTKVNNMMFDEEGRVLCVIDLDTVMPSFVFSDYGDFLRTGANVVAEDCPDMDAVKFNVEIFKAFTEGYLASAKSFLTEVEIENLPYAVKLFPYMQCVRFLWDYLNGDKYWKCQYPDHNFVRANNQFHLLLSTEAHEAEMEDFIQKQLKA